MAVLKFLVKCLVFLSLAISHVHGNCESFTESEGTAILPCLTGLYSLNITGVLSIDQSCRYYNHVLRCISDKLNQTCGVTGLHKHVPDYLRSKPGIREQFFQECSVSELLTSNGFCNDSEAVLISGISVCVPQEVPSLCDYIGSVFLKCYNTDELDDYFQCSNGEIRKAFVNESDWFLDNWGFNMSSCWNGDNIIVDICRTPMLQNNITMDYCFFLVNNFDFANIMTNEDMCKQYTYFLKCIEELFENFNSEGNYKCSLESLHKWVPRYFEAHISNYYTGYTFNASLCNVSEFDVSDYCSDRRAVFLTNVNLCQMESREIFKCRYIKQLIETCDQGWYAYGRPTNMKCTNRQNELAMESEAEYFQSKFSINITDCMQGEIRYGQEICNRTISDRDIIYQQFYSCFKYMGDYGHFNRSGLLPMNEACRIYNYAMHCVENRLKTYPDYNDCDINSISKWFQGEYYNKSTMELLVPNCKVTTHLNGRFCEDSSAVFFGMVGFNSESYRLTNLRRPGVEDACSNVNKVFQYYNMYGHIVDRCKFSDIQSSIFNNAFVINNKWGTNISMVNCFQGCLSSSSCITYSTVGYEAYASFNSTKCSCSYYCHSGNDNCCPDFYSGCVCTSNIWSYIDRDACKYLISNFNKTGTMNEDDACRMYSYYLNCVQTQSMCPLEQLHDLVSDYIRGYHNDLYRFNTSRCNVSTVIPLSEFCSDDRTLFQVGVNSECTEPKKDEIFTCGYLSDKAHNCYNWNHASSLINCSDTQRMNALLRNSDWFYNTWNINISVCENESISICNASSTFGRSSLYARATDCFQDLHVWFNRTGLAKSIDGCSYYMQILQCINKAFGWNNYFKPCTDKHLHDLLTKHVIQSTKTYSVIHNCSVPTTIDKSFCEDEEAKLAYLLGVCRRTPAVLHGRTLQNQSNICQILNSILVECHYEVRNPHFQCDFSNMYSPLDPNTGLLAERFNIDISDCFSGCGTSYACCTDDAHHNYCSASFNGTECSCNDTCVDEMNCCPDFQEACHNITIVYTGGQTFENYSQPRTPGDFFGYGADEGDSMIFGDDVLSPIVLIPWGFPTANRFFDKLKIGTNGIILFSVERNFNPPTPINFNVVGGIDFIAPFWTDINAPEGRSHVYYHVYDKTKVHYIGDNTWYFLKRVSEEIRHFYKTNYFSATWVLIATWDKVLPPSFMSSAEEMTFQCILATDGMSSYVIFNYMSMNVTSVKGRQAAMGYRLSNSKMNDLSFKDAAFEINTFSGNFGLNGYYMYKLDDGNKQNFKQLCYNWYDTHRGRSSTIFNQIASERFNCPCTLSNIRFDWRWMKIRSPTEGVSCYALFATRLLPATRSCCYNDFYGSYIRIYPSAGAYHMHHPIFAPRSFASEESLPKEYCCFRSNLCHNYYELRPIGSCYGKLPFKYRWFYGDPHIESLDGKQYTFNGIGEYVLMKIVNENVTFELQARTERILNKNGTYSNATVFTAFAMKEENTTFQVELTDDRTKLVVFSNEYDYTAKYNEDPEFYVITEYIKLSRHNDTLVVVFGVSGLQLNITLGIRMLTFSTTVPDDFAGQTVGLVGNFDGDDTNDFILPNGTVLTENQTRTERQIFYNFGVNWAITKKESVFKYPPGKSLDDYQDKDFIPIFIEDFKPEDVNKAKQLCGNKTSSAACIYDFLLTKNENIGKDSGRVKIEAMEKVKTSENEVPVISGDRAINATIGLPTKIQVKGSDDGNFTYHIISGPKMKFILDVTTSFYIWTPTNVDPINISITVIDNFDLVATPLDVRVTMCGNCSGHGYCIYNETVFLTTFFEYAKCVCEPGWTGNQCEDDVNGCSGQPCSDGRNCTDLTPVEEVKFGRSFNCSPCPNGYTDKNNKCFDINECNKSNICTQKCVNTIGSFSCACKTGFRLTEGYKCIDIDECIEKNDCEQRCTNTEGSYNCSCVNGYTFNADNKSCTEEANKMDVCKNMSCSYTCDIKENRVAYCICPKGFHLSSDRRSCEDDNECVDKICQHNCNNTNGSFICSCHAGYMLDTDGISCRECGIRKWGLNCANDCNCANGECDPVFGCKCDPGFSGADCDQDVNECKITGICNDSYKICINTHGSYDCQCKDGYVEEGTMCININECESVILNQCDTRTTTCVDTSGNYTCDCKSGYIYDGLYQCKDINECLVNHPCEQICLNNDGSFKCECENGFSIMDDRTNCRKLSDYELCAPLNCSYPCTLNKGNVSCFCSSWSVLDSDGKTCKDIDECQINTTNKCSFKYLCHNTIGGYNCSCPDGFRLENDGRTCKECNGTGWGPNCENECNCAPGAVTCNSTKGCICMEGYNGTRCENDIDECLEGPCNGQHKYCENIPGSYLCKCQQGYINKSSDCENIDECKTGQHNCEHICNDFDGGYNCSCYPGFYLTENGKCKDIDECQPGRHNCDQICHNTLGSFQCLCQEGYILNTTTRHSCYVKTHCESTNNCTQICGVIDDGKEKCSCRQGYILNKDGKTCKNINECEQNPKICDQICTDLTPGYQCSCNPGYHLDLNNRKSCIECNSGHFGLNCNQTCRCFDENTAYCDNNDGSCICRHGWTGLLCETDIDECNGTSNHCQNESLCKNTNGSYECIICENGLKNGDKQECFHTTEIVDLPTTEGTEISSIQTTDSSSVSETQSNYSDTTEGTGMQTTMFSEASSIQTTENPKTRSKRPEFIENTSKKTTVMTEFTSTGTTKKARIPEHESIKMEVTLTIDVAIKSEDLTTKYNDTKKKVESMLEKLYATQLSTFDIIVKKLRIGSLIILYEARAKKDESAELSVVLFNAVNGKTELQFNDTSIKVQQAEIGSTDQIQVVIKPGEDKRRSLCKIYSHVSDCSENNCELTGEMPKCRKISSESSLTAVFTIGVITGVCLIMLIVILAIIAKFVNYKKSMNKKRNNSNDIGMVDITSRGKPEYNTYNPIIHTSKNPIEEPSVEFNNYYSISSRSTWREMLPDTHQSQSTYKIRRPSVSSSINK